MNSKAIRNCSLLESSLFSGIAKATEAIISRNPVKDTEPVDVLRAHLGDEARMLEQTFRRPRQENDRQW